MRNFVLKYLFVFSFFCLATWLIWNKFDYPLIGIEDANIFFVYAKHFADGYGFVYNVGGEKVEGFSSLLWTLLCALVFSLSAKPELTLLVINIAIIALGATVVLSYLQSALFSQEDNCYAKLLWSVIFLALLLTSPTYLVWNTIALMENAIWSTLLVFATIFVIKKNISSQMIFSVFIPLSVLLLLTRPESFLWITVFTVILFVRRTLVDGIIQALRAMAPLFVVIVVTVIILTVFRLLYFGYPLPNTYYAKVSPSLSYNFSQGILYFSKYFLSNPIVWLCVVAVVLSGVHTILTFMERKSTDDGLLFLPIIASIGLLVPMITGGDHFGSFRFYQGVYPILLLCLLYCLKSVLPRYIQLEFNPNASRWPQLIFVSSLVFLFVSSFVFDQARTWKSFKEISNMSVEFEIAKRSREKGQFIQEMFITLPKLPSIGVIAAGGVKFTYPGEVIDLMGLNNLLMAHNGGGRLGIKNHAAFEKATFYQLQPDIVQPQIVSNEDWQYEMIDLKESWGNIEPLKGLYNDSAFLESYVYAKIGKKETETGEALVGWVKKNFLNDLDASDYFVIERYE
jgi:arabinofuranosyltransferase